MRGGALPQRAGVRAGAERRSRRRATSTCDIAYGGAFYASVDARASGLAVAPGDLPALIELGREVKRGLEAEHEVVHPDEPELRDVYGVIFCQTEGPATRSTQRNVTVFADGEVDRSPCGSGTSARLALLARRGELPTGELLRHRSIVGTEFPAASSGGRRAGRPPWSPRSRARRYRTGEHRFVLDPDDPLGPGFLLR